MTSLSMPRAAVRIFAIGVASVAIALPVLVAAEDLKMLGYSTDDVRHFVSVGSRTPACRFAIAADAELRPNHAISVQAASDGAGYHALCRRDLQRAGASASVLRVNDVMTAVMCATIKTGGFSTQNVPACAAGRR